MIRSYRVSRYVRSVYSKWRRQRDGNILRANYAINPLEKSREIKDPVKQELAAMLRHKEIFIPSEERLH